MNLLLIAILFYSPFTIVMVCVSVIMTTYKHQHYIGQAIDSVIAQNFTDWELLIGDDSPTQETREVIQHYVKKYPKKIFARHHNPNKWIVANNNFLLEQANPASDYIAFLEWDDVWTTDYLSTKLTVFTTYPQTALVYNNLDIINSHSVVTKQNYFAHMTKVLRNETLTPLEFLTGKYYHSYSTLMMKKEMLAQYPIVTLTENKHYITSDWDLFWNVAINYPVYWVEKILTLYRIHAKNNSKNLAKLYENILLSTKKVIDTYHVQPDTNVRFKQTMLHVIISFFSGNRMATFRFLVRSFFLDKTTKCMQRVWLLLLNCLPHSWWIFLFNKLKKYAT